MARMEGSGKSASLALARLPEKSGTKTSDQEQRKRLFAAKQADRQAREGHRQGLRQ